MGVLFFKTFDASFSLITIRRIKWQRLEELCIALVVFQRRLRREMGRILEPLIRGAKHFTTATVPGVCQAKHGDERSPTGAKEGSSGRTAIKRS